MSEEAQTASAPARSSKKLTIVLFILLAILLAGCGFLYMRYQQALAKQPKTDAERIAQITSRLDSAVELPNEQPTIATVGDVKKLAEPQLAARAKTGDELLVYAQAKRVILYRPSEQKVIDMFRVESPQTAGEATTR